MFASWLITRTQKYFLVNKKLFQPNIFLLSSALHKWNREISSYLHSSIYQNTIVLFDGMQSMGIDVTVDAREHIPIFHFALTDQASYFLNWNRETKVLFQHTMFNIKWKRTAMKKDRNQLNSKRKIITFARR